MADALPSTDDLLGPEPAAPSPRYGDPNFPGGSLPFWQAPLGRAIGGMIGYHPAPETPAHLPSVDDVLGLAPPEPFPTENIPSGSRWDAFVAQSPIGSVLNAFGHGAVNGWGTGNLGFSPETVEALKKAGIFPDVEKGQGGLVRAANEALLRPAAAALDATMRAGGALISGAQAAVAQAGEEVGAPQLGRDIAGIPEGDPFLVLGREGVPHGEAAPAAPALASTAPPGSLGFSTTGEAAFPAGSWLPQARSLRIIGEGEAGWKGTAPYGTGAPDSVVRGAVAADQEAAEASGQPGGARPGSGAADAPPDIHSVARQIAPETFQEYDGLAAQQQALRERVAAEQAALQQQAEAQAPHAAEIADLQARLQDTTPRLAKKYQARLDDLIPERDAFLNDQFTMGALTRDTPEIQAMREQLQQIDFRMRDLAPDVTAAYREAAQQFPEPEAAPVEVAAPPPEVAQEPAPAAEALQEAPTQPAEAQAVAPRPPVNIAEDVAGKLIAAGRPEDEANAAAALLQAHYEARAARFQGAKGTASDLYQADGPEIRGGGAGGRAGAAAGKIRVREFAQGGRGTATFSARPIITLFEKADASTFMHETGHQWLEELMHDAADARAPAGLVSDAAAVRRWLGADPEKAVTGRQHEKFARGFEQYLMEGRAPTQALARVFAQFKAWLTTIYRTVSQLRAPITDDIRDVFDRLIAANPEGGEPAPVIAPERGPVEEVETAPRDVTTPRKDRQSVAVAVSSDLADIQEADVATTPPDQAAAAADQVRAEFEKTAETHVPEVLDELAGRQSGGEAGGGTTPGRDASGDGGAPEPVADSSSGAQQSAPVVDGGSGPPTEGDRLSGQPAGRAGTEQPAGGDATAPFGRSDTALLDKAGNIRLDNLNQPEDVNAVLRQAAEANNDFLSARRGVLGDAEVLDLADALGMDARTLNARKIGQAFNAEEVVAARKLLVDSATFTRERMAAAASGSDADVLAYAEAKARHQMIQEQVAGITAEAGRALRAFRELGGEVKQAEALGDFLHATTGRTLFQLRAEAQLGMQLDTAQQVSKFLDDARKPGFSDMLLEYWINGLISGPATHTTYAVGNALLAVWKAVPETAAASAVGMVRRAIGGAAEHVEMGEVGAQLYGMMKGLREGIVAAGQAIKSGQTVALPGEAVADFALQQGLRGAIPGKFGTVMRLPSRGVATIHSFFRALGYSQAKAGLAYRAAAAEGLTGDAFARRVADLSTNPDAALMEAARGAATEQTLMGKGGSFTRALARLSNEPILGAPLLKFVMPFVKIGSNIMGQGLLERSPLGIFDPEVRANLLGRNGPIAQDTQIARIGVGTAVAGATVGLAAQGLMTGGGPADPKEAAVWRMTGRQPYSVRIGETWYGLHRLGPLAVILGVGADMYEMGHAIETEEADKIAGLMVGAVTKGLLDETWMRGPAQLIQALEDPDRYGARWARDEVSSFVPFSVGMSQVARAIDPYSRQARTILEAAKAKVPFLSETLLPRIDMWGQPMPNKEALGVGGLSAIYETRVNNDPVNQALLRLHVAPATIERKVRGVTLTDQQYQTLAITAGRMTKMRLDALVGSPGFSALPDGIQAQTIRQTITSARETARTLLMMQNPQIIRDAMAAKQALAGR